MLDKPVIQYVVEEALEPDEVTDAIVVTSPTSGAPQLLPARHALEQLLRARGKEAYADAVARAGSLPVDFRFQYKPNGLATPSARPPTRWRGELLVLLGDYVVPARDICTKMLEVSRAHGGASVIAVAPCAPEEVSRYGVVAGERIDALPGCEGARTTSRARCGASRAWLRSPRPIRPPRTSTSWAATS